MNRRLLLKGAVGVGLVAGMGALGRYAVFAAYYPRQAVVGRLRAGEVRTGDVWVAESWVDELVTVEAEGADLAPETAAALRSRGTVPQARSRHRIATIDHVTRERADLLGRIGPARRFGRLRDALGAHVRAHGFRSDA